MKRYILACFILLFAQMVFAQSDTLRLTISEAVSLARTQSPDILVARHSFRSSYWNYRSYQANYLPSLSLASNPSFDHRINTVVLPDGTSAFVGQNQLSTDATLAVSQNIPWTGGNLSLRTGLQRLDLYGNNRSISYKSVPVNIVYQQNLFGYNSLKWEKRIEPLYYQEAKKTYVEALELVSAKANEKFFNLARAQSNFRIATMNLANADTLYVYAQGRYDLGTINENEMLQLEVRTLNEENRMLNALTSVDDNMQDLRIYLGITDNVVIEVVTEEEIPEFTVDVNRALAYAMENSPDMVKMERRLHESESNVAYARSQSGFKADLYMQLGLTQMGNDIPTAYKNPLNQQYFQVGVNIPILDWGRAKGRNEKAKSNHEMVKTQVEQDRVNFVFNIEKVIKQFNLQGNRVSVASRVDQVAARRNDVAMRLYILGKSNILELNSATVERDTARSDYIEALYNYWRLYYALRSLTLYDFEKEIPITEDYDLLLQ